MIIRQAAEDDAEAVGALTEQVYVGEGYVNPQCTPGHAAELADGLSRIRESTVLVAEVDGRIVGTVTLAKAGDRLSHLAQPGEMEVRLLAVAANARRSGVASALMDAAEARGKPVVLCTESEMTAAQRLYERRGYQRAPDLDWSAESIPLIAYRLPDSR